MVGEIGIVVESPTISAKCPSTPVPIVQPARARISWGRPRYPPVVKAMSSLLCVQAPPPLRQEDQQSAKLSQTALWTETESVAESRIEPDSEAGGEINWLPPNCFSTVAGCVLQCRPPIFRKTDNLQPNLSATHKNLPRSKSVDFQRSVFRFHDRAATCVGQGTNQSGKRRYHRGWRLGHQSVQGLNASTGRHTEGPRKVAYRLRSLDKTDCPGRSSAWTGTARPAVAIAAIETILTTSARRTCTRPGRIRRSVRCGPAGSGTDSRCRKYWFRRRPTSPSSGRRRRR